MWSTIIGCLFIVSGVAFAVNPERLRRRIQKKSLRTIRRTLVAIVAGAGLLLFAVGWQLEGILAKSCTMAGFLLLLKGVYLFKAKSADMMAARLMHLSALYLRLFAVGQIVLGIALVVRACS
jgi:uncharacterized protein YjeT (DUF2065 family)